MLVSELLCICRLNFWILFFFIYKFCSIGFCFWFYKWVQCIFISHQLIRNYTAKFCTLKFDLIIFGMIWVFVGIDNSKLMHLCYRYWYVIWIALNVKKKIVRFNFLSSRFVHRIKRINWYIAADFDWSEFQNSSKNNLFWSK